MAKTYYRGELYYADLGKGVGSEQEGYRPVVIIQNNVGNKFSPTVIIAPVTTDHEAKAHLPTHCYIGEESGLDTPSVILLEQPRTIDKTRLGHFIGRLNREKLRQLNQALAISVDLKASSKSIVRLCLCNSCAQKVGGTGAFSLLQKRHGERKAGRCSACKVNLGIEYYVIQRKEEN